MRHHRRLFSALLLLSCVIVMFSSLAGCVPNQAYLESKEQGYFPTAYDYPFAKWVCREKNLYFCMWPSEHSMTGEYISDGKTQGVNVRSFFDELSFLFFTPEEKTESEYKDADGVPFYRYTYASDEEKVRLTAKYEYHDGIITCTVRTSEHEDFRSGEVFTFENAGLVTQSPEARWRCQELDFYLDSYEGVDFFYAGKLAPDESTVYTIWAIRHDVNGKFDVLTNGTNSEYVSYYYANTYIEFKDDKMIWQITDLVQRCPDRDTGWDYPGATLTFIREPLP